MEVEGDEFWVVATDEGVDGGFEFWVIESFREGAVYGSFAIVFDAHAIAESDEDVLLAFHEVDLEKVLSHGVAGAEFERLVKPSDLFRDRFSLYENRA